MNSQDLLAKLVSFDTTSHWSNLPLVDFVMRYLAQFGIEAKLLPDASGLKANLWASLGPRRAGGLLLAGHTDVVPVAGQAWQSPPFELHESQGLLYGRGSTDMKGFLASVLAAVPTFLRAPLHCPIHLAFTFDEEVGCFGAEALVKELGVNLPLPAMAIVGEPSNMQPITAHKGLCAYDTVITGHDVHSSLVHLGASSIRAASRAVQYLYELADEMAGQAQCTGMQMPAYSTINVGRIQGGQARNIVAKEASFQWEHRFIPQVDAHGPAKQLDAFVAQYVLPQLRANAVGSAQVDVQTRLMAHVPAFEAVSDSAIVSLVSQWSGSSQSSKVPYGAEAGQLAGRGIDTVICGPGSIEQAHQPNEYLSIQQLQACDAFMLSMAAWAQSAQAVV
jgi:acetylornithine deacetylase